MPDTDPRVDSVVPAVPTDGTLVAASDSELAHALCVRDLAALDEAFRRHATQVANKVRRIAGGYYVDDVVQEVFLSLWRMPERFQPERGSLAAYLGTLTYGRTIDAVRSEQAWQRRHRNLTSQSRPENEVEEVAMAGVRVAELRTALRALPMSERVAIELAFFGGYTYRQVAAQLREPEGTIKSRIRSGLRRLEAALQRMGSAGV